MDSPHAYLVTGGCGLQGSSIVETLLPTLENGSKITVLARNPTTNLFPGVDYRKCDITSADSVREALGQAKPDVVFHCAGIMTAARRPVPDETVRITNVDGTRHLLEESQKLGAVKAFVFTSSASTVQKPGQVKTRGADETWPTTEESDAVDIYPKTKATAERMVLAADTEGGMRTAALRPAVIYGERDNDLIPMMMASLRAGKQKMQVGDGKNLFSFTYVKNATQGHLLAMEKLLSTDPKEVNRVAGESFFVTNEEKVPFWDFARMVFKCAGTDVREEEVWKIPLSGALAVAWAMEWISWLTGKKPGLTRVATRLTSVDRYFEIGKAKERLGYKPEVAWDEGVRRGVEWFLENEKNEKHEAHVIRMDVVSGADLVIIIVPNLNYQVRPVHDGGFSGNQIDTPEGTVVLNRGDAVADNYK
ncbi:C-3 sterol dehydrogenase [Zalerion maritima]|uniref:C-3 sterol dehydrogenase n=1 Tax=Zalerion maritima TaxID=339359 RepID=A0AAD5RUD9_9PEZI|nr:C-3 sterol dehydrogenase [Zalerion maritima]